MSQLKLGENLKELGQLRVEKAYNDWIVDARRFAVRYCAKTGSVSVNEIRDWANRTNNHPDDPLAYSAVFKGKEWITTGERSKVRHASGHTRKVERWTYRSTVYRRDEAE